MKHLRLRLILAAVGAASVAAAANPVPVEFQGRWVPSPAACTSPTAVLVAADRLTLINGKDSEALGGVEMAGSGYFAHDYQGIMQVLLTDSSGDQPAVMTFNLGEKAGVAEIEYSPVMPGKSTPQLDAYNAHIKKLDLAKRFPLAKIALKKCAGG
jgi:hypothetical protein